MSKKKNTDVKYMVQTGDVFNETDEDSTWIVGDTFFDKEPPIAMCRHINLDGGDDEEDRFDLRYVDRCVRLRQSFVEEGFADMDVYAIYKLTKKQLRRGLFLAKQNTDGVSTIEELRRKMLFSATLEKCRRTCRATMAMTRRAMTPKCPN